MILNLDGVASFQFISPRPGQRENGDSVDSEIFDQHVIFSPDGVACFEFISPRPGKPETGDMVDLEKFDET